MKAIIDKHNWYKSSRQRETLSNKMRSLMEEGQFGKVTFKGDKLRYKYLQPLEGNTSSQLILALTEEFLDGVVSLSTPQEHPPCTIDIDYDGYLIYHFNPPLLLI